MGRYYNHSIANKIHKTILWPNLLHIQAFGGSIPFDIENKREAEEKKIFEIRKRLPSSFDGFMDPKGVFPKRKITFTNR